MPIMPPFKGSNFNLSDISMDRSNHSTASSYPVNRTTKKSTSNVAPSKKKVTFTSSVRVRKISSHRSFSDEERANMWYSSSESKAVRGQAVGTVKKMMKGIDVDASPDDCSRGLEFKTPQKNKIRQTRKQDILWTLLVEQECEIEQHGVADANFLADVYISSSRQCIQEAHKRGLKDELESLRASMPECA